MKTIYLNLKRFDILQEFDGINEIGSFEEYGKRIVKGIEEMKFDLPITVFFQESNLLSALRERKTISIGCQGVHYSDVSKDGNFGAFTTLRTAKAMKSISVNDCLIGHCEERNHLNHLMELAESSYDISKILNEEIKRATEVGMNVLYCIGEKENEVERREEVLRNQLEVGLEGIDLSKVTVAYEPIWAIGPKKTPPSREYIEKTVEFIKSVKDVRVVYGGGLKRENAKILASIPSLDGGLIALTDFGSDFGFRLQSLKEIIETYKRGLDDES